MFTVVVAACYLSTVIVSIGENKKNLQTKKKKLPLFERFYQKQGSSRKFPASILYARGKCNLIFSKKKEKKGGVGGSDNFCVYRLLLPWLAILNSLEAPNKISFIRITDENFKMEDYNNYKVSSKRPEVPSCFPGSEVVSHAVHVVGANTYLPFAVQCQHIDVCC